MINPEERPAGYVIAERRVDGSNKGRLAIDWDGVVYENRADGEAELAAANRPDKYEPTRPPGHWKLYELWEAS